MQTEKNKRVAVVGGGIAGLSAALRLAEQGHRVDLYEAAPALGGRTKSFYHEATQAWMDNGPHLMVGAYVRTKRLLADVGAAHHVTWQKNLCLPLWDKRRGFFALQASAKLPMALALLVGVATMPGHGWASVKAMLGVARTMHHRDPKQTVRQWLEEIHAPDILIQDMLEVLCLGVMNESLDTANAKTFARVLATSFSAHTHAKMGWFNKPLNQALVEPIVAKLQQYEVAIHLKHRVQSLGDLNHDAVVLALPLFARNRLLGIKAHVDTQVISNIHLWFEEALDGPDMLGLLGTYSQWLFNMSAMTKQEGVAHWCVTVSADISSQRQDGCVQQVLEDIEAVLGKPLPKLLHARLVREKRATVLVREHGNIVLPSHVFDAGEAPYPGQLPATIELAVLSGERAAHAVGVRIAE